MTMLADLVCDRVARAIAAMSDAASPAQAYICVGLAWSMKLLRALPYPILFAIADRMMPNRK